METKGVVHCFQKSIETRQLRYETYVGDGDSKAYSSVVSADPYPGLTVQKGECIGHIQKRVGSRLCRLRKKESLGGASRLSDKAINKLQNYFGIAIRKNNTSVISMKKQLEPFSFTVVKLLTQKHVVCSVTIMRVHGANITKQNCKARNTETTQVKNY